MNVILCWNHYETGLTSIALAYANNMVNWIAYLWSWDHQFELLRFDRLSAVIIKTIKNVNPVLAQVWHLIDAPSFWIWNSNFKILGSRTINWSKCKSFWMIPLGRVASFTLVHSSTCDAEGYIPLFFWHRESWWTIDESWIQDRCSTFVAGPRFLLLWSTIIYVMGRVLFLARSCVVEIQPFWLVVKKNQIPL